MLIELNYLINKVQKNKKENKMLNLITFKEFCDLLKANPNTVKTWKRRKKLPANIFFKIAGTQYVFIDKFEQWIKETQELRGIEYDS